MFNFIARYFSSFGSLITIPVRIIFKIIKKLFPMREFTIIEIPGGNIKTYEENSFWRFTTFCGKLGLLIWVGWSTYVFIYHRPLLQKQATQLEEIKQKHERHLQDLKVYLKKYNDLARSLNVIDDKILSKKKISESEKDILIKKRLNTWGQLDFLYAHISEVFTLSNYSPEFLKLSELSVEYELTKSENETLKKSNKSLAENMLTISSIDEEIFNTVSKITEDGTKELEKKIQKINNVLFSLGLSRDKLIKKANNFSNHLVGASFVPLKIKDDIDNKYKKLAEKLEIWNGLTRLNIILPLGRPVDKTRITSYFGMRNDPFTHELKKHKGIDFAGSIGTELKTVSPGRVISAGERFGYGSTVEVDHGLGFTTLYAHLSKILVSRGDWIQKGTVVGLAGSSGRSTGPHLHYEIRFNGHPFDPIKFVKE